MAVKLKPASGHDRTLDTTRKILQFLFNEGVFAWRHNVLPVPLVGGGFRPGGKSGVPDIIGISPAGGRFISVEVKTGRDRLRPEQDGFIRQARALGALMFIVSDFDDFLMQWKILFPSQMNTTVT